jgi:MFS family permease
MVKVSDSSPADGETTTRWNGQLVRWVVVLILANVMVDTVIVAPLLVLPQMLEHFGTDQAAWLNASAMLAGAMWAPLLGKSADIYGKRRMLLAALFAGCLGSLVCLWAPNIWVFLAGRFLQGAAMAAVFLTIALIRQICVPRIAMTAVGILTSGSAVLGIVSPFLFEMLIAQFGFQSVFIVSAILAALAAVCVRSFVPESPIKTPGKVDVTGAILLGAGIAAVLAYVSLGADAGWTAVWLVALLVGGLIALAGWVIVALRVAEPVIDIRNLSGPLVITLLIVVLGTGSYQSLLQLMSLIARVGSDQGLGYGLGAGEGTLGLLFAAPAFGVVIGGTLAGWLAARIGPAWPLLGGVATGVVASAGTLLSVSAFAPAVLFVALLGSAAGAIVTSGFNLAISIVPAERQGVVSGLVQVMLSIGSVVLNVVGAAVLTSTAIVMEGRTTNSVTGVYSYISIAGVLFIVATVLALRIAQSHRHPATIT